MSVVEANEPLKTEEASSSSPQGQKIAASGDKQARQRTSGLVKWFNPGKGFGFLKTTDGEDEIFVHQTSIKAEGFRSLKEGEIVEFDLEYGEDGRAKAINVTGPDGSPPQGAPRPPLRSAPPYAIMPAQPQFPYYDPYTGYPQPFIPRGGRFPHPGRGYLMPGRGMAYGRGFGPALERPPPPGTPGFSSGFQVVVHNLPWSVTWQELKDVFSPTPGIVRADVILDAAGRSRGFGTVRYKTREEALQAAEMMNGADIGGRIVTVRIDRFA